MHKEVRRKKKMMNKWHPILLSPLVLVRSTSVRHPVSRFIEEKKRKNEKKTLIHLSDYVSARKKGQFTSIRWEVGVIRGANKFQTSKRLVVVAGGGLGFMRIAGNGVFRLIYPLT